MVSSKPQLREALPSAELFPAQPSGPETGPAARSSLSKSNRSQHLLDDWTAFKSALGRKFVQCSAASTDTQKLLQGLRQIGSARSYFTQLRHVRMRSHAIPDSLLINVVFVNVEPHWRVALTRLQQLRSTDNLPLDEIEEACIREDEAEFARVSSSRAPVFQQKPQTDPTAVRRQPTALSYLRISSCAKSSSFGQRNGLKPPAPGRNAFQANSKLTPVSSARHVKVASISAASRTQLYVDKLSGTPVPSISAQVIKARSLISSPKQLVFEDTVNKNLITFLLDGGADHSIMSRAFALTNGITVHPLDPPIATTFASNSSEVIRFAIEPLPLQCQGYRCNPLSPIGFHLTD
ncbi:hypothetical protein Efla_003569 [Eimeria flavescens]